jgi:hypothetical protein
MEVWKMYFATAGGGCAAAYVVVRRQNCRDLERFPKSSYTL